VKGTDGVLIPMRVLATAFGLVMVAAVALQADAPGLLASVLAAVAVVGSIGYAPLATVAVATAIAALALSDTAPTLTALAELSATCYLAVRHGGRGDTVTVPTVLAVTGASALGLVATSIPVELPWAPLVAPFAVLAAFVVAVRGLSDGGGRRAG
jgi:hypothetical protein